VDERRASRAQRLRPVGDMLRSDAERRVGTGRAAPAATARTAESGGSGTVSSERGARSKMDGDGRRGPGRLPQRRAPAVAVLALLVLGGAACQSTRGELVVFGEEQRLRYELRERDLRALQYYLSDRVVLERVRSGGVRKVERGRLLLRAGTAVQQVVIQRGTPGAIEPAARVGETERGFRLEVSFEHGAPLAFLPAGERGGYALARPRASGFLTELLGGPQRFEVDFAGDAWTVVGGGDARLLIERSALGRLARSRRVLPGVRTRDAR